MFAPEQVRLSQFHDALDSLSQSDAVFTSLPFFSCSEINAMIAQSKTVTFRPATAIVGNNVHQDMDVCFPAPRIGAYDACASLLEQAIASWSRCQDFISPDFCLNDFAIQRYGKGSKGIGIHKDGLRYHYFVFIICLSGSSRLFHCADRQGTQRHEIDDSPGRLVILKAPGFAGFDADRRALHGVDAITDGRLSIGFRYDSKKQTIR